MTTDDKQDKAPEKKPEAPDKSKKPEEKEPGPGIEKDPHRGTAGSPSQHKELDPEAERNNDENTTEGIP